MKLRVPTKIITTALIAAVMLSPLSGTALHAVSKEDTSQDKVTLLPKTSYKLINGKKLRPKDYAGKAMLITFWATWCPPCVAEIPHLNDLYKDYKDKGLVILGLSIDEKKSTVKRFMKKTAINYPLAMATKQTIKELGPISAVPTTLIVNAKGEILYKVMGYESKEKLEEIILPLLPKIKSNSQKESQEQVKKEI